MAQTTNGSLNQLEINGNDQALPHLPVIKLGNAGTIFGFPIPVGDIVLGPFPKLGANAIVDYGDVNGGTDVLLNIESVHRLTLTDITVMIKTTTTGTGGVNIGYTEADGTQHADALGVITSIVGAAGTFTKLNEANFVAGSFWGQQLPKGAKLTAKANGTLTAGSLWIDLTYLIYAAQGA